VVKKEIVIQAAQIQKYIDQGQTLNLMARCEDIAIASALK
jgi:hypothetical protein